MNVYCNIQHAGRKNSAYSVYNDVFVDLDVDLEVLPPKQFFFFKKNELKKLRKRAEYFDIIEENERDVNSLKKLNLFEDVTELRDSIYALVSPNTPAIFNQRTRTTKNRLLLLDVLNEKFYRIHKNDYKKIMGDFERGSIVQVKNGVGTQIEYEQIEKIENLDEVEANHLCLRITSDITNLLNGNLDLCKKCRNNCKQSGYVTDIICPKFRSTRGRKNKNDK